MRSNLISSHCIALLMIAWQCARNVVFETLEDYFSKNLLWNVFVCARSCFAVRTRRNSRNYAKRPGLVSP